VPPSPHPSPAPGLPPGDCAPASITDGTIPTCLNWCPRHPAEHCSRCDCGTCGLCARPPTPPAPPPFPPTVPGGSVTHALKLVVRSSGEVSDYSSEVVSNIKSHVASAAGVAPSAVDVAVAPASVLLTITVTAANATHAGKMTSAFRARLTSPAAASDMLGVQVENVQEISAVATQRDANGTPYGGGTLSIGAILGIVFGVLALIVGVVLLLWCWRRHRRAKAAPNFA